MILEEEVDKIRAVRQSIVARCGHDPKRLLEHYQWLSGELRASGQFRFVEPSPGAPTQAAREEPPPCGPQGL